MVTEHENVDFYNLIASERGMPAGWRWYELKVIDDVDHSGILVTGAVCNALFLRGKRKGDTNWSKMDISTRRQILVSRHEYEDRRKKWQTDTGKCAECLGSGKRVTGFSAGNGTTYSPCKKCAATGVIKD